MSALAARLAVLTPAQLTATVLAMASLLPGGEAALLPQLPLPDMKATATSLTALNDDVVAHLPRRGGVPQVDEAAYRAVSTRVLALRRELTVRAVALERAGAWSSCLDYARVARSVVNEAVMWEEVRHNRWRDTVDGCLRRLTVKAVTRMVDEVSDADVWADVLGEYGDECPEIVDILEEAIARRDAHQCLGSR
eukprot:TRINITY_DN1131_c0_g1_i6.p2 TRINITY_DN1131_c0_g1~~TRINITY_DN1131_c0_g1_i6.p2  ORF type:complete len:194 (-),score=67.96 TRINITY_DN1131_c0_g1_i6:81-662(-)